MTGGAPAYTWRVLAVLCVIVVITQAVPNYGAPVLVAAMAKDLGLNRQAVGGVFSSYMICLGVMSPIAALFINRFGARAALCTGALVAALGAFLIATNVHTPVAMLIIFGALVGSSAALGGILPAMTVVSDWFLARRTLAMSVLYCAVSIGGVAVVGVLAGLLRAGWSWQSGWILIGAAAATVALLALLAVRNRPEDAKRAAPGAAPAGATGAGINATGPHPDITVRKAIAAPIFLVLVPAAIATFSGAGLLTAHGLLHLTDLGVSPASAASVLAAYPLSALGGKVMVGTIGERVDPRLIAGGAVVGVGAGLVLLMISAHLVPALAGASMIGFGTGVVLVCVPVILREQFGRKPFATLAGIVLAAQTIGGSAAPLLGGRAYDMGWGYAPSFYTTALICALTGAALLMASRPSRKAAIA